MTNHDPVTFLILPEVEVPIYPTREAYLSAFISLMRPRLSGLGFILPDAIRVSIGFPSKGGLNRARPKKGETWAFEASKDGSLEVFISPVVESPMEALVVLCGQLGYCCVGNNDKEAFKRFCGALGLAGKPTTLFAGDELKSFLEKKLEDLGPFPGSPLCPDAIIKDVTEKKPGSRMLKAQCEAPDCGYTIRLAAKWVERGLPTCVCGQSFIGPAINNDGEIAEETK